MYQDYINNMTLKKEYFFLHHDTSNELNSLFEDNKDVLRKNNIDKIGQFKRKIIELGIESFKENI